MLTANQPAQLTSDLLSPPRRILPTQSKLQTLGESAEHTVGVGYAVFLSLKEARETAEEEARKTGGAPPPPMDDVSPRRMMTPFALGEGWAWSSVWSWKHRPTECATLW